MNLVDKIKDLLAKEQGTEPSPDPTPADPTPGEPTPEPGKEPEPTAPETFTREEVTAMLEKQQKDTEAALAEIVKSFKGEGSPAVADPAAPVETVSDFSQWNQEVEKIKENLKN